MQQQQQQQQQMTGMKPVQPQFTFEGGHLVMFHKEATGLPQVKDANVNDRDRMQDLLSTEKYMTQGYNISMNEASHQALYQVLKKNHDTCHQLERAIFNTMFKKGWYKLPVADAQSVTHAYNQFKQYQSQFPFPAQIQQQQTTSQQQQASQQAGGTTGMSMGSSQAVTGMVHDMYSQSGSSQQLDQKVDQALKQAEQGQMPSGYTGGTTRAH